MIDWKNYLQGEIFLSGTKEEVFVKIKTKNQEIVHCVGLCQHGGFIGYCFGARKSSWGIKGDTIWSPQGARRIHECYKCDGWKVDPNAKQFFGQFLQETNKIITNSYSSGFF